MFVIGPLYAPTTPDYFWRDARPLRAGEERGVLAEALGAPHDEMRVGEPEAPRKPVTPPPAALLLPFAPSRRFVIGFGVAVAIGWTLSIAVVVSTLAIWLARGAP